MVGAGEGLREHCKARGVLRAGPVPRALLGVQQVADLASFVGLTCAVVDRGE